VNPADPKAGGPISFETFEPARFAMGDTVRYAERMQLIEMEPRQDLSSTGYVLANPGVEYLVLQPEPSEAFTVTLEPGAYAVEWFGVDGRKTLESENVTAEEAGPVNLEPPFADGPGVVYLKVT
jgi:hypothetical protein